MEKKLERVDEVAIAEIEKVFMQCCEEIKPLSESQKSSMLDSCISLHENGDMPIAILYTVSLALFGMKGPEYLRTKLSIDARRAEFVKIRKDKALDSKAVSRLGEALLGKLAA